MKSLYIVDLDGTLSNDKWRRKYLPTEEVAETLDNGQERVNELKEEDFDRYNHAMGADAPYPGMQKLVQKQFKYGRVVYLTARPFEYAEATEKWLSLHNLDGHEKIFMRDPGNMQSSPDMKSAVLGNLFGRVFKGGRFKDTTRIKVYDDRVDVLRKLLDSSKNWHLKELQRVEFVRVEEDAITDIATRAYRSPGDNYAVVHNNGIDTPYAEKGITFTPKECEGTFEKVEPELSAGKITLDEAEEAIDKFGKALKEGLDAVDAKLHPVSEELRKMAETFEERQSIYGDNYKEFGYIFDHLMKLDPTGGLPESPTDYARLGVLVQIVGKLTRYCANFSKGGHEDSLHDLSVYAAMLQDLDRSGL